MFKATHKILGADDGHNFEVKEEVQFIEFVNSEDGNPVGRFTNSRGLHQSVLMNDVEEIK